MTDATPDIDQQTSQPGSELKTPMIRVLAQFAKDLSFENPGILASQQGAQSPEIESSGGNIQRRSEALGQGQAPGIGRFHH